MIDALGEHPCGVCVEPKDTASLLGALLGLLEKRQEWEEIGQRGCKRVEEFYNNKGVIEQLVALWVDAYKSQRGVSHKPQFASIMSHTKGLVVTEREYD